MSQKTFRENCHHCNGEGTYNDPHEYDPLARSACHCCEGKGYTKRVLEVSNEPCPSCHGARRFSHTKEVYSTNLFGQETRRSVKKTYPCSLCNETGKILYASHVTKEKCPACNGSGGSYRWEKRMFFSGEVRKVIKCSTCSGSGKVDKITKYPFDGKDLR